MLPWVYMIDVIGFHILFIHALLVCVYYMLGDYYASVDLLKKLRILVILLFLATYFLTRVSNLILFPPYFLLPRMSFNCSV